MWLQQLVPEHTVQIRQSLFSQQHASRAQGPRFRHAFEHVQIPAHIGITLTGTILVATGCFGMRQNCIVIDFQLQLMTQDSDYYRHLFHLKFSRWICAKHRIAFVGEDSILSATESDANGATVATPGMRFIFAQHVAGEVKLAMLADVDVVIIKNLVVGSCRPMQIDVSDTAFGILSQDSQLFMINSAGICYKHISKSSFVFFLPCAYLHIRILLWARGGSVLFLPLTLLMAFFRVKVRHT